MMAAVQNNFAPGTISLEGPAAVSAKREEAAKHALSASKIQHSREIQNEVDARKKAENEKLSLDRKKESLIAKCDATYHQKMSYESENLQLKGELSNLKFSFDKETREYMRQKEDIKRDNGIQLETKKLDFERKLDVEKSNATEMKRDLNEKIEKMTKEISTLNEKVQNKDVEIQALNLEHKNKMTESMDKMMKESKKEVNCLMEQHAKDLDERALEIEKSQIENNRMKGELSDKENENEQNLKKQAEDDNERFEERVKVLETQHKKALDHAEAEKNELERHYLSELKSEKAGFDSTLKNVEERHKLKIQAEKDEYEKVKLNLDRTIERLSNTIKEHENTMIEQENEFNRNVKQQLMNKEEELTTNFAQKLKESEDAIRATLEHQMNVMKNDLQFKVERSKMLVESKDEDLKREKEKTHRIVNDLERAERNYRDAKHNAKMEEERMRTDIEILRKKLAHEKDLSARELRHFRFPFNPTADSGLHSPERRGSAEEY